MVRQALRVTDPAVSSGTCTSMTPTIHRMKHLTLEAVKPTPPGSFQELGWAHICAVAPASDLEESCVLLRSNHPIAYLWVFRFRT